jgi:hypothetical protein
MTTGRYNLSFTSGSLLLLDSLIIASLYLEEEDWESVNKKVIAENLLQSRTLRTLKTICSEIILRLKMLREPELRFLVDASRQEQGYVLWIAVCRRYTFIGDFAVEVLRENYITHKFKLTYDDYDSFFYRKSEWHPELEKISLKTGKKLRQVLFKMLRDADLLSTDRHINAAFFSHELKNLIARDEKRDLMYFPVLQSYI